MEKDQIFILKDRGVVFVNGEDAKNFLQNIVTNDLNKVNESHSCFSSLLTPQGKYLFDFIIIKHKQGYFLDCELKQIDDLIKRLSVYKLNSKIEIMNLSNEFQVAVISKEKFVSIDGAKDTEGNTLSYRSDPFFIDPRKKELGARVIINLEKLYMSIKKLGLKLGDVKEYYELSHSLGIPQIDTKNLQEKVFGLECNFEKLNGIDFKKGCYVGQENTARMKLREKLRKKLFALKSDGEIEINSDVSFKNEVIGKVLIGSPYPFALIKISEPSFSDFKNQELNIGKQKSKIIY
tara:strand:- start:640 stop:1515 length:876 start_codon:yes stop_codon:yes gene_type:complete